MTDKIAYQGGCHCGAVRFQAESEPIDSAICHCRSCQKNVGAESVGWASFAVELVSWSGERTFYESSKGNTRSFCGRCGCSLTYQNDPGTIDLVLACLDDPEQVPPAKEIWLSHRLAWNAVNEDLPGYPEFRSKGS